MEVYNRTYKTGYRVRRFLKSWLKHEQFKSWIRRVSYDDTLFHCAICNTNLSCKTFTNIKKHAKSMRHKINVEKSISQHKNVISKKNKNDVSKKDNDENNVTSKKNNGKNNVTSKRVSGRKVTSKKYYDKNNVTSGEDADKDSVTSEEDDDNDKDYVISDTGKNGITSDEDVTSEKDNDETSKKKVNNWRKRPFSLLWLERKEFQPWLRESRYPGHTFFCTTCDRDFVGGLSQIYRHAYSKTHKDKFKSTQTSELKEELNMETDELLPLEERKRRAEIRFAALIAEKEIPHDTADDILNFFQNVGKHPHVLGCINITRSSSFNDTFNDT